MLACAGFIGLANGQAVINERRNQSSSFDQAKGDYYKGRSPFIKRLFGGGSDEEPEPEPEPTRQPAPFVYEYRVINLTSYPVHQVIVMDRVTDHFKTTDADPDPANLSDGVATWNLGEMGARETRIIKVSGTAPEEGTIRTCGCATYSPILCEPIRVVKADQQLVKEGPANVTLCDPILYTVRVTNTGSSVLTGVRITDEMEEGLTTNGYRSAFADMGILRPGETRTFNL
jgi:uncharacterized repeat protein (TIGR01451 family)